MKDPPNRRGRHYQRIIRANLAQGIHKFFVTDDSFSRNRAWEALFDRMIALREEGLKFAMTIQVDTLCHKIPHFIEKAGRAGVDRVFIGLENINPEALGGARKHQNDITEYRTMLQAWDAYYTPKHDVATEALATTHPHPRARGVAALRLINIHSKRDRWARV